MARIAAILLVLASGSAYAQSDKVLRYVSQNGERAYLREGPSYDHRVLWVYRHRGYPFAVLAQFDVWRRVRAADGAVGWMSAAMLSDQRTVLVTGKGQAKIYENSASGKVVGLADPGAIADLKACSREACRISGQGIDGWIPKNRIWGVGADEMFGR